MHKNQLFREFECGFSIEATAKICFKSVSTIKSWDRGKPIPPECKRLLRIVSGQELSPNPDWDGFKMNKYMLELPNGKLVTPQEIMTGQALLELGGKSEAEIASKLLRFSRVLSMIRIQKEQHKKVRF
ncbi:regulator [Vibrio coralliilyticus]|uniref:regulator n=1 Tax=Vibrio coralliilyticus TaxID=190893 RepID=UPI001E53D266|nr:regulator [Vibrio coralliilyticus]MCC2524323.1 regulator [Vibrio coralliilyticus]